MSTLQTHIERCERAKGEPVNAAEDIDPDTVRVVYTPGQEAGQ